MLPQNCFLIESEQAFAHTKPRLAGYAVTDDDLIFGTDGLDAYLAAGGDQNALRNGRFFAVLPQTSKTIVKTDRTGQEQLFLFERGDDWAISNSFLLLTSHVAKRHRLSLYPPALIGFHLKGGRHVGEQLVSHKTAIEDIRMIPAINELVIDRATNTLRETRRSFMTEFALNGASYEETLLRFLERRAGLLAAVSSMKHPINLLLSGGYDSRLVLALLLKSGMPEQLNITSHEHKKDDYASASGIASKLGLSLNQSQRKPTARASASESLKLWLLSCGCTYLPLYRLGNYQQDRDFEFRLTGDQPTGWDHFAGNARFNGTAHKVSKDIEVALKHYQDGGQVANDFIGVLDELDVNHDHPKAMLAHYWAVRSRHHCGRNWYKSLGSERLVTPLMDEDMVSLEFHAGIQGWSYKKFFADAFSALGGWALEMPFETPDRAFGAELLDSSPFRGGVEINPKPLNVFGSGSESTANAPPSMLDLPLKAKVTDEALKDQLTHNFWTADLARESGCFTTEDIALAKREIHGESNDPLDCRKLTHFTMAEVILNIIETSSTH